MIFMLRTYNLTQLLQNPTKRAPNIEKLKLEKMNESEMSKPPSYFYILCLNYILTKVLGGVGSSAARTPKIF